MKDVHDFWPKIDPTYVLYGSPSRGLPFRASEGRGEGGSQQKEDLLCISYIEKIGKTADKGEGVSFRPKIVDVLHGRPLRGLLILKINFFCVRKICN